MVVALVLFPFLLLWALIALVHDGVQAVDRGSRLGQSGVWTIAVVAVLGITLVAGASRPSNTDRGGTASTDPPARMASSSSDRADCERAIGVDLLVVILGRNTLRITPVASDCPAQPASETALNSHHSGGHSSGLVGTLGGGHEAAGAGASLAAPRLSSTLNQYAVLSYSEKLVSTTG